MARLSCVRHVRCLVVALGVTGLLGVGPLWAGDTDGDVVDNLRQLANLGGEKDWNRDHIRIEGMIDGLFEQKGWTGESDEFARKLALDVSSIPPWQPMDRFNHLYEQVVERYHLSDESAVQVRAKMTREAGRFLLQHGGLVLRQLKEGMSTRAANKPFTPEQVARWTKESQPILSEVQTTIERICKEISPLLDAEAREVLARDLKSFKKRNRVVEDIASRWSEGKWTPEDWGLDNDPVHAAAAAMAKKKEALKARPKPVKNKQPQREAIRFCVRNDPSTWDACVIRFEEQFDLDVGQKSTAESILVELRVRAEDYLRSYDNQMKTAPKDSRGSEERLAPVRAIYQELNERLDAVLTSSQRAQAGN